jgi:Transposase
VERRAEAGVAESLAPGAVVTEIARRADICPGQIYRWRREIRVGSGFAQVLIAPVGDGVGCPAAPAIEIEFAGKARLRNPGLDPGWVGGGRGQSVIGAMIPVPSGVAGVAGSWPHRHAARHEQSGAASPRGVEARPPCRRSLCFSRKTGRSGQAVVMGWRWPLPVRQAAGAGSIRLATRRGGRGGAEPGATVDAARGDRLADAATDVAA